jgi:predicted Fe-S protein YdhL (DUF1289 family)
VETNCIRSKCYGYIRLVKDNKYVCSGCKRIYTKQEVVFLNSRSLKHWKMAK